MTNEELWNELSESGLFEEMNDTLWDSYPVVRNGKEVWVPRYHLTLEERRSFVDWLRKTAESGSLLRAVELECVVTCGGEYSNEQAGPLSSFDLADQLGGGNMHAP